MKHLLEVGTWNRQEHFHFFSRMEEPYFGVVVEVDVTRAYHKAKTLGISFFQYYLYQSLVASNAIENFRYRMEDGAAYCYDVVHASATIARADHTFGFSFIEYTDSLATFVKNSNDEIAAVQQTAGLRLNDDTNRIDVIHYSTIPWLRFTSLTHARSFTFQDSAPKISFGKYIREGEKMKMPVAIYVNHALVDGYHVGLLVEKFQQLLDK